MKNGFFDRQILLAKDLIFSAFYDAHFRVKSLKNATIFFKKINDVYVENLVTSNINLLYFKDTFR